jgi:hypothetical protein
VQCIKQHTKHISKGVRMHCHNLPTVDAMVLLSAAMHTGHAMTVLAAKSHQLCWIAAEATATAAHSSAAAAARFRYG